MKPTIPVNLLDTQAEPSDEALDSIMQSLVLHARERAEEANRLLFLRLEKETAAVVNAYAKYQAPPERPA